MNNLHNAYEFERERRNDERRAAADSQRARGLGSKQRASFSAPVMLTGIAAVIIAILRVL